MTDKIVVLSTCADREEADRLARTLVESGLAACVSVIPQISSYYRWKGALECSEEYLLLMKSSRELFGELRRRLETAHSYELPEVLAIPVLDGSPNYLNWLQGELRRAGGEDASGDNEQSV